MLKVLYFTSEIKKKFGVYKVIKILEKNFKKKGIITISHKIGDIFKKNPNIIHIHGCWRPKLFFVFLLAKLKSVKIIVSPHGMLDPYSLLQKKIKKKIAWHLYQKFIINFCDLIIVNSNIEKLNVKKLNFKQKEIIINHGIFINKRIYLNNKKIQNLRFVFFSRIHPSKNLNNLLEIWIRNSFFKKYNLDIFGEVSDKHYYHHILNKIKHTNNIKYRGSIKGNVSKKLASYDVFVHPSNSENFGLVILEAIASGLFVILNKKLDWHILEEKGFGYLIKLNSKNLEKKIKIIEKKKKIYKRSYF